VRWGVKAQGALVIYSTARDHMTITCSCMVLFGSTYLLLFMSPLVTFLIQSSVLDPSYMFQAVMRLIKRLGCASLNVDGLCRALLVPADDCALVRMRVGH